MCFFFFYSHIIYIYIYLSNLRQNKGKINKILQLQDKVIRIINFNRKNDSVAELYENITILKLSDYMKLLNCMFARDTLTASQIPALKIVF